SHTKCDLSQEADSLYTRGLQYISGDRDVPNMMVTISYFKQVANLEHSEVQLILA
ncbi:unnamed protein product, partial [Rotaria magnacalcarata]